MLRFSEKSAWNCRILLAIAAAATVSSSAASAVGPGVPTTGPDVTINRLNDVATYASGATDGTVGYTVGTTSCNIGDVPVNWCDNAGGCGGVMRPEQHPVIAMGVYRLKANRLEQIGMSWLKHGFVSTNSNEGDFCKLGTSCQSPPQGGNQLGIGCTDTYWATLNGGRPMGRRSEVNATTGEFPFPITGGGESSQPSHQRTRVDTDDVDPAQNAGASFWIEGQYISDNDAQAGNGLNNASYRAVTFGGSPNFSIALTGSALVRERSAIHAWRTADPTVSIHNVDVPGAIVERFEVARRVSNNGDGTWHYEYAVRNMNSNRSARSFTVEFAPGTAISNTGFHDVDHHSNEPYETTEWVASSPPVTGSVTWSTDSFETDGDANALRWATMFNFWFDAAAAPDAEVHVLGLFKPGTPTEARWRWPIFADGFEAHNFVAWTLTGTVD
jgi:hypothetical protein